VERDSEEMYGRGSGLMPLAAGAFLCQTVGSKTLRRTNKKTLGRVECQCGAITTPARMMQLAVGLVVNSPGRCEKAPTNKDGVSTEFDVYS